MAIGLIITFVGIGEKGFKTIQLRQTFTTQTHSSNINHPSLPLENIWRDFDCKIFQTHWSHAGVGGGGADHHQGDHVHGA